MSAYTVDEIKEKVTTDPRWTELAIVALYGKQTLSEQVSQQTVEHNSVGFNGCDAEILSSFAEWVLSGRRLTVKQLALAQKRIGKYSGQLTVIANG